MSSQAVADTLGAEKEAVPLTPQGLVNEEGVKLSLSGHFDEAVRNFDKAIKDTKDDDAKLPLFLANRAHALIALDRVDEAITDCVKACKLDPKCVMASVAHSKAYAYKQKLGQAIDILKQALSKDKENKGLQQKIKMLEGEQKLETIVPKNDPARQKMNQYVDWLKGQGVEYPKIKVRKIDQNTTVVLAIQDIKKDESVLFVPADLILGTDSTTDVPANSWLNWNPAVQGKMAQNKKEQNSMALYYISEKNNLKSKHKRLFDQLNQRDMSTHVAMWEPETNEVLKACWLHPHIENLQKEIESDYNIVQSEIPADIRGEFTLQEYKEAWVLADIYFSGYIKSKEDHGHVALIPFTNFFNFNDDNSTYAKWNHEKNGYELLALRKINRGEEVCLRSVAQTNDYFLMKKGMSHPLKPTKIQLPITLNKEKDPMFNAKVAIMGGKFNSRTFSIGKNMNDPYFMDYINFMRFYLWSGSQQELNRMRAMEIQRKQQMKIAYNNDNAFLGSICPPGSSKSEMMMWEVVGHQIQSKMASYPKSIKDTKEVLENSMKEEGPKLTAQQQTAYEYLFEEQQTITTIMQLSMVFRELLEKPFDELMKELQEKPFYSQFRGYIESQILPIKQREFQFEQQLVAAKKAQEGGEAVKELPAGADAGAGSLY